MNKKGFTLIELIMTIALITFIVTIIGTILINGTKNYTYLNSQAVIANELDEALQSIDNFVRLSQNLINQYSYNSTNFSLSSTTLILNLPSIDENGNILVNQNDVAILSQNGTIFNQIVIPSQGSYRPPSDREIASHIQQVNFDVQTINGKTLVSTTITANDNIEGRNNEINLSSGEILYNQL